MVSGYSTSTSLPRVDELSTDPRVLGHHNMNLEVGARSNDPNVEVEVENTSLDVSPHDT